MKNFVYLFFLLFSKVSFTNERHPYHIGSVEINYSQKSRTYQITGKFFIDDLENSINKKYSTQLHFQDEKYKQQLNNYIKKYCEEYFRLKSDNQFVKVNFLGYEEDRESVDIYLESDKVNAPKKVETAVSFLYNLFDDQSNIIHIIVNGNRKSEKLTYPDRYLFQLF